MVGLKRLDEGFAPLLGDEPKVLVLGSMPSQQSLEKQEYYGHPQNAFWWIMAQLFGFSRDLSYAERVLQLQQSQIAVWDVVHTCHRPGSLDADIDAQTVIANPIPELLQRCSSIKVLCFNGKAAYQLYRKHIERSPTLPCLQLPSTSPAYASLRPEGKLLQWRDLLAYMS